MATKTEKLSIKEMLSLHLNPLFNPFLPPDQMMLLKLLRARKKQFGKHDYVFRAGDDLDEINILLSGKAHIVREDYLGNRVILLELTPGTMFAESIALCPQAKAPVSVLAQQDCSVLAFEASALSEDWGEYNRLQRLLGNQLIQILSEKNRQLTNKNSILSQRCLRDKLLYYLSTQAIETDSLDFLIPFNRQELADFLAVDRAALSRKLSELEAEGYFVFRKNHFTLNSGCFDSLAEL